ncbi:MAG: hypothetical protein CMG04_02690 [Candidatus Marinimicrobia bacterium]|nr:hypothetical protein [Candidatus Neomarinimicrobiota bacterium]|tara:strand:+ start:191 stop:439 length:249 start_codon:yes stop_codon:yes gene_type:complete
MTRVYRIFVSLLLVIGIVAVAPASTVVDTDQQICNVKAGSSDGEVIASADVKKKKKKKKKGIKGSKGKKKKKGFFSKAFGSK